jgi:hypothetical protein
MFICDVSIDFDHEDRVDGHVGHWVIHPEVCPPGWKGFGHGLAEISADARASTTPSSRLCRAVSGIVRPRYASCPRSVISPTSSACGGGEAADHTADQQIDYGSDALVKRSYWKAAVLGALA